MRKNDGTSEEDILQNQFTAYLLTAVKRHKILYLKRKEAHQRAELSLDQYDFDLPCGADMDLTLSLLKQIENPLLHLALP